MESGPSLKVVLGERGTCRLSVRVVVGDIDLEIGSVVDTGLWGEGGGLPEVMDAHIASTSIVEVAADARGFFSIFLQIISLLIFCEKKEREHTPEHAYSSS